MGYTDRYFTGVRQKDLEAILLNPVLEICMGL